MPFCLFPGMVRTHGVSTKDSTGQPPCSVPVSRKPAHLAVRPTYLAILPSTFCPPPPPRSFNFHSRFIHDLTLDVFSQECVYNNGRGKDMSLDMHRSGGCTHLAESRPPGHAAGEWQQRAAAAMPPCIPRRTLRPLPLAPAVHNNLWSNIDVGEGTRPFASSGQTVRGAHAAANNTWCAAGMPRHAAGGRCCTFASLAHAVALLKCRAWLYRLRLVHSLTWCTRHWVRLSRFSLCHRRRPPPSPTIPAATCRWNIYSSARAELSLPDCDFG